MGASRCLTVEPSPRLGAAELVHKVMVLATLCISAYFPPVARRTHALVDTLPTIHTTQGVNNDYLQKTCHPLAVSALVFA
jgi:hypothetical protein